MKKIIFLILFFIPLSTFAISTPVEKVFNDIDKNYKYYNELQTLYDKGIFFTDINGNFNPKKLLTREEFVGVMSEITCKKCIKPNIDYKYILDYNKSEYFFDVKRENKYFYCIAGAFKSNYIKGYDIGTKCNNGIFDKQKAPFCPKNTIILEEALAMLFRASSILTDSQAEFIRNEIKNGKSYPKLSSYIIPKLSDGSIYSFYPDFYKALNYSVTEYDTDGNKKIYKLLGGDLDNINPKKEISREEFLRMSYILLKGNSCIENDIYDIGLKIKVFDKNCNKDKYEKCRLSDLNPGKDSFDFMAEIGLPNKEKVSNNDNYIWRFYNFSSGKDIIKKGYYLDDFKFLEKGKYRVYLTVETDSGKFGEVYNDFNISNSIKDNLKLSIKTSSILGHKGINIDFEGLSGNKNLIKSYFWEFGDGDTAYSKKVSHIFKEAGIYEVKLFSFDYFGIRNDSSVLIYVYDEKDNLDTDGDGVLDVNDKCIDIPGDKKNYGCPLNEDIDGDGVLNNIDKCVLVFGDKDNYGCPIFEKKCNNDKDCLEGFFCLEGFCKVRDFAKNCEYNGGNLFYGNIICETCPCDYSVDFNAKIRDCDIIFPAVTSPDETKVYSKGEFYEIRK